MKINGRVLKCLEKALNNEQKDYAFKLVFLKVYHLHVVLIAIRYAKIKRNKYVNHYTSQVFSIH